MKRKLSWLVIAMVMLLSVVALAAPVGQPKKAQDFCTDCEDNCYRYSDNVKDYNACVLLCNYAGCNIPIIQ